MAQTVPQEWPGRDRWDLLRTELRAQLKKEIGDRRGEEAAAGAGCQVDKPVEIRIPSALHTDAAVRFFKVGYGWTESPRSRTCGWFKIGARRGSQELVRIGSVKDLGELLSLTDLEIASPDVLGVLVDRVYFEWDSSIGDPKSSTYREAEGFVVENVAGMWVFATDKAGHVVGVRRTR
ncbi:MAG: hypothetical protein L0323_09100 [Planctomycetes bacterium]|nr:hypothetical protein [Planctomycetota bacterium]